MQLFDFQYSSVLPLIIGLIKWLVLGFMIVSSTIWQRRLLAILLVTGGILSCIGSLFKIAHWSGADALLVAGAALLLVTYGWWFKVKATWLLLDYLKLAWISGMAASLVAVALFHPLARLMNGIANALFWGMVLLFVYQRWIRRPGPVAR